MDRRKLNSLLGIRRGVLGDIQSTFKSLKGQHVSTQLDLASGFRHLRIAERDLHSSILRGCQRVLYEFIRAVFGLAGPPAAFTRVYKHAFGPRNPDVVS